MAVVNANNLLFGPAGIKFDLASGLAKGCADEVEVNRLVQLRHHNARGSQSEIITAPIFLGELNAEISSDPSAADKFIRENEAIVNAAFFRDANKGGGLGVPTFLFAAAPSYNLRPQDAEIEKAFGIKLSTSTEVHVDWIMDRAPKHRFIEPGETALKRQQAKEAYLRALSVLRSLPSGSLELLGLPSAQLKTLEDIAEKIISQRTRDWKVHDYLTRTWRDWAILLPDTFTAEAVLEALSDLPSYIGAPGTMSGDMDEKVYTHGTLSAALPGVVRERALLAASTAIARNPSFLFTYEPFDLQCGAKNPDFMWRKDISLMSVDVRRGDAIGYRIFEKGFVDEIYASYPTDTWNIHRHHVGLFQWDQQIKPTTKGNLLSSMTFRQQQGWSQLSEEERQWVRDPFSVILGVHALNSEKTQAYVDSFVRSFDNSAFYRGKLSVDKNFYVLFVPRSRVDEVRAYLDRWSINGVTVHSLESLEAFRILVGERGV